MFPSLTSRHSVTSLFIVAIDRPSYYLLYSVCHKQKYPRKGVFLFVLYATRSRITSTSSVQGKSGMTRRCGSFDCVLEGFCGLELRGNRCRDLDLFTSLRVHTHASGALGGFEASETGNRNFLSACQCLGDGIEYRFYGHGCLLLYFDAGCCLYCVDQFYFVH